MHPHSGEGYPSPAETQTTPETFYEAFKEAREAFYVLPFEEEFQELCQERNVNPDDRISPRYWSAVSDFAHRKVAEQRAAGVPEESLVVKELAASVPDAIYTQMYLSTKRGAPRNEVEGALRAASHFNGLIRTAADLYPDVTPKQMASSLSKIANISLEHPAVHAEAPTILRNTVRGAQFEKQHVQILEATGLRSRDTNVTEDVYEGADSIAYRPDGSAVRINFKASPRAIHRLGGEGNYAYDRRGVLIVSLLNNEEAGDSFTLDPALADQKASELRDAIMAQPHNGRKQHLQAV